MARALEPIDFYGETLFAMQKGGEVLVALKPICASLGLDWDAQRQRLRRDSVLNATAVITTAVAEDGKDRDVLCLPLSYLNGWLFGISEHRVKPELKGKVVAYKRECYRVLWAHFGDRTMEALERASEPPIAEPGGEYETLGDDEPGEQTEKMLTFWLGLVREARLVSGPIAAREVWRRSPLPALPDMPGNVTPEDGAFGGVGRFVAERLEAAPGVVTPAAVIWRSYLDWCREVKVSPATQTYLGRRLPGYGFGKSRGNTVAYHGVRVRSDPVA